MHVGYYQFRFSTPSSSGMFKCIAWGCLLWNYIYSAYYSVYCDYFVMLTSCCVSDLHAKLCPHRNVWLRLFIVVLQELPNWFL